MMTRAALEKRLTDREGVGPEGSLEALERDLATLIDELGPQGAPLVAASLAEHDEATVYDAAVVLELAEAYAAAHADKLAQAAMAQLRPDGPPLLVSILGRAGGPEIVAQLRKTLDTTRPDAALLSAIADAVVDTHSPEGARWLDELLARPDIAGSLRSDLIAARASLGGVS